MHSTTHFSYDDEIMGHENPWGDTILHQYVRLSETPEKLKLSMDKLPKVSAAIMAKTVNNQGKIPYDILVERKLSTQIDNQFREALMPPTMDISPTIKPLSYKLDIKEVLNEYKPIRGSLLEYHLQLAVQILNRCNNDGFKSSTSVSQNHDPVELLEVQKKVDKLEEEAFKAIEQKMTALLDTITLIAPLKESKDKLQELDVNFSQHNSEIIALSAEPFIKNNIGNCHHLSWIGLSQLKNITDLVTNIEVAVVTNGGHIFIVIGRNPKIDMDHISEWGDSAVVADPWARTVAPAKLAKLATHRCIHFRDKKGQWQPFNIVTSFNHNFHELGIALHDFNYANQRVINFYFRLRSNLSLSSAILLEDFEDVEIIGFNNFDLWKKQLIQKARTEKLKNNSLLVKFYLEMEVSDKDATITELLAIYNKKSLSKICNVLLYAILHDDHSIFLDPKLNILTHNFNLLIPFAVIFKANHYISTAYQLHLVDEFDTLQALTVAVLQKDAEMMELIIREAAKSGITIEKLNQLIDKGYAIFYVNFYDPISWAVYSNYYNGLIMLLSEGFSAFNVNINNDISIVKERIQVKSLPEAKSYHCQGANHSFFGRSQSKNDVLFQYKKDVNDLVRTFFKPLKKSNYQIGDIICDYLAHPISSNSAIR